MKGTYSLRNNIQFSSFIHFKRTKRRNRIRENQLTNVDKFLETTVKKTIENENNL